MADVVRAALRSLTKADRDALKAIRSINGIPGIEQVPAPDLVLCTFATDQKTYTGLVTAQQCARIAEVSGKSAHVVEKRLLKLLCSVRYALGELTDAMLPPCKKVQKALEPERLLAIPIKPPDNLGKCDYVNSSGQPDCVNNVLQEDCNRLLGSFTLGGTC